MPVEEASIDNGLRHVPARAKMSLQPSRRGLVPPFIAMDVLRAANEREAAGAHVIHLEVGQPGSPGARGGARRRAAGPRRRADRLYRRARHRPVATGDRRALPEQYGVAVEPGEVVVTTGSSAAFLLAFLAAFEAGDRVALAVPGYPAYRNILSALGIEPVPIAVGANAHYQPTPEILADLGRIDGLDRRQPGQPDRHHDRRAASSRGSPPGAATMASA